MSPTDLGNIFSTASQRSSGLTLKQFLTALAMISPDLITLTNHIVAQLGPQVGGDGWSAGGGFPVACLESAPYRIQLYEISRLLMSLALCFGGLRTENLAARQSLLLVLCSCGLVQAAMRRSPPAFRCATWT